MTELTQEESRLLFATLGEVREQRADRLTEASRQMAAGVEGLEPTVEQLTEELRNLKRIRDKLAGER